LIRFLPNLLTLIRLFLVVPIVLALLNRYYLLVLILFCIAALTDLLDGLIARKFDYKTRFGSLLDPIADKCLILSISVMLWYSNLLPWWLILVVVLRELILVTTICVYRIVYGPYQAKPLLLGKINTVLQLILIIIILLNELMGFPLLNIFVFYFFIILIVSSILSVGQYIVLGLQRYWQVLQK